MDKEDEEKKGSKRASLASLTFGIVKVGRSTFRRDMHCPSVGQRNGTWPACNYVVS
jgi:hypothetical protein